MLNKLNKIIIGVFSVISIIFFMIAVIDSWFIFQAYQIWLEIKDVMSFEDYLNSIMKETGKQNDPSIQKIKEAFMKQEGIDPKLADQYKDLTPAQLLKAKINGSLILGTVAAGLAYLIYHLYN